jgi:hypothetical protein
MKPLIEALEARQLLSAAFGFNPVARLLAKADGVTDPAVVADVAAVKADQTAVQAAAGTVKDQTSDTRAALKDTIQSSFDLLKTDRQAVRDAQNDPTALAAAQDKLKADRTKAKSDIKTAFDAVRADGTDAKTALKDASNKLFTDVKQLRIDLQNAGVIPTAPTPTPSPMPSPTPMPTPVPPVQHDVTLTPDQAKTAVDAINTAAQSISGINQDAVKKLTDDVTAAASDSTLTPDERTQLRDDVKSVLQSVKMSDVRTILTSLRGVSGVLPTAAASWFHR